MSADSIFGPGVVVVPPVPVTPTAPSMTPRRDWKGVSPSQIVAFKTCPRKWYSASILGDREPQRGNQTKGEGIHKALEVYMTTGEILPVVTMPDQQNNNAPVDISTLEFVQVASKFLPPPFTDREHWAPIQSDGGGIMVEQAGELPTFEEGPGLSQFIDFVEAYKSTAKITDFKTSSDFRYCKTPEELKQDTQLNANAKWLFAVSDYQEIEIGHLYLLTKNVHPKARPVYVTVTRADVEKVWARDMAIVREMLNWAKLGPSSALKLPPNTASCDMYGGCYYRAKCGFSAGTKPLFQIRSQPTMSDTATPSTAPAPGSFLDRMMKAAQTPPATASPAPAAAPPPAEVGALFGTPPANTNAAPAPAAAPVQTTIMPPSVVKAAAPAGLAALFGAPAPAAAPAATPVVAAAPPVVAAAPPVVAAPAEIVPVGGMTPADAPPDTSTPAEVAAANDSPEGEEAEATPATTSTESASDTTPATEAPGATKRKRRTKAEMEAARAAEAMAASAPPSAPLSGGLGSLFGGAAPTVATSTPPVAAAAVATMLSTSAPVVEAAPVTVGASAPVVEAAPVTVGAAAPAFGEVQNAPVPATPPKIDGALAALREQLNNPDPAYECPVRVLFIDCMPGKGWVGEPPAHLADFMHAFERAAASSAKALDYRLIKFESAGWLAVGIRVLMKGLPSAMIIDSRTPGAAVFESVVVPYCQAIFRGTR